MLLVFGGVYYFFLRTPSSSPSGTAVAETPANAPKQTATTNQFQKFVEVVGVRMITEDKKPVAKFVVVNHSGTEIDNLAANVTLRASTSRSDEDPVGTFSFKVPELGPNESKDMTEPLKTKFKMYELPDWQKTTAEIEITSPAP